MQKAASDRWAQVEDELGTGVELQRSGGLMVAETEEQAAEAGRPRGDHHAARQDPAEVDKILGVDEDEAVGRPGDHRDAEGERRHEQQAAPVGARDRAEHRFRSPLGDDDSREAVRFDDPTHEERQEDEWDDGEGEDPAEPERLLREAVDDRGQAGPHGIARGHQRHRLRPLVGGGELDRAHLREPDGGAQERPADREDRPCACAPCRGSEARAVLPGASVRRPLSDTPRPGRPR